MLYGFYVGGRHLFCAKIIATEYLIDNIFTMRECNDLGKRSSLDMELVNAMRKDYVVRGKAPHNMACMNVLSTVMFTVGMGICIYYPKYDGLSTTYPCPSLSALFGAIDNFQNS